MGYFISATLSCMVMWLQWPCEQLSLIKQGVIVLLILIGVRQSVKLAFHLLSNFVSRVSIIGAFNQSV